MVWAKVLVNHAVADLGGVRGVQMHLPLAATKCIFAYVTARVHQLYSSGMQQQQPGKVTHSRISSLLIARRLARPKVALRYSVRTPV